MLRKLGQQLVECAEAVEAAPASLEGERVTKAQVERLIDAMVSASKVRAHLKRMLGIKDAQWEPNSFMDRVRAALLPVVVSEIQRAGGKVSGTSASSVRADLRGMAQGEDTRDRGPALDEKRSMDSEDLYVGQEVEVLRGNYKGKVGKIVDLSVEGDQVDVLMADGQERHLGLRDVRSAMMPRRGMAKSEAVDVVQPEDDPGSVALTRIERVAEWVAQSPRMQALLQRAGVRDVAPIVADLVLVMTAGLQRAGAHVSGMPASKVRTQLRALAMGEAAGDVSEVDVMGHKLPFSKIGGGFDGPRIYAEKDGSLTIIVGHMAGSGSFYVPPHVLGDRYDLGSEKDVEGKVAEELVARIAPATKRYEQTILDALKAVGAVPKK